MFKTTEKKRRAMTLYWRKKAEDPVWKEKEKARNSESKRKNRANKRLTPAVEAADLVEVVPEQAQETAPLVDAIPETAPLVQSVGAVPDDRIPLNLYLDLDETIIFRKRYPLSNTAIFENVIIFEDSNTNETHELIIRPFIEDFLNFAVKMFITVSIYSSATEGYVTAVRNRLDPGGNMFTKIFTRNDCTKDSFHRKRLHTCEDALHLDNDKECLEQLPGVLPSFLWIPMFTGSSEDNELQVLMEFFEGHRMLKDAGSFIAAWTTFMHNREAMYKMYDGKNYVRYSAHSRDARFHPLSPDENWRVDGAFKETNVKQELNKKWTHWYKTDIRKLDLLKLRPDVWLNDEVINFKMELLNEKSPRDHFFSSLFMKQLIDSGDKSNGEDYFYSKVQRWTLTTSVKVGVDVFSKKRLFFPVNITNTHWILIVVFMEVLRICAYDSMGGAQMKYLKAILRWLKDEHRDKKGADLEQEFQLMPLRRTTPQQNNGTDCGVFTCMVADFLSDDLPLDFDHTHIEFFRRKMCHDILNRDGKRIIRR